MIAELLGGPQDGKEYEVQDGAPYVRFPVMDETPVYMQSIEDEYPTSISIKYEIYERKKYRLVDGSTKWLFRFTGYRWET